MRDKSLVKEILGEMHWINSNISRGDIDDESLFNLAVEILARIPNPIGLTQRQYGSITKDNIKEQVLKLWNKE